MMSVSPDKPAIQRKEILRSKHILEGTPIPTLLQLAEQALNTSETHYRDLFECANDAILLFLQRQYMMG